MEVVWAMWKVCEVILEEVRTPMGPPCMCGLSRDPHAFVGGGSAIRMGNTPWGHDVVGRGPVGRPHRNGGSAIRDGDTPWGQGESSNSFNVILGEGEVGVHWRLTPGPRVSRTKNLLRAGTKSLAIPSSCWDQESRDTFVLGPRVSRFESNGY